MLNDPLSRVIPKMAVPTIIAFLINSIYALADTVFVSFLGTNATAAVSDQPEGTFERLRYFLGGDRPSQTAYQKLFLALFFEGSRLESKFSQSGISTMTPHKPKSVLHSLPPILRNENPNSISSYSKAQ